MGIRRSTAAVALATAALAMTPQAAYAEIVCVRVTVIGPVINTISTGYTCAHTPLSTWYREVVTPLGPFEVIVEVITPAGDTS